MVSAEGVEMAALDMRSAGRLGGHPANVISPPSIPATVLVLHERFWEKVDVGKRDECWLWNGAVQRGYGAFHITDSAGRRRQVNAQRVAYTLTWGPIPDGEHILHRCDVPLCCNPFHLESGTRSENMRQAAERGRLSSRRTARRLTAEQRMRVALDIEAGLPVRQVAEAHGISPATVRKIRDERSAR